MVLGLLFGGGLALAAAIQSTGLAEWIAKGIGSIGTLPLLGMFALVTLVITFLTEVTSNTTAAVAFLPLLAAAPNAIVFGTGHMRIPSTINAGFALNIGGVVIVKLLTYFIVAAVWIR